MVSINIYDLVMQMINFGILYLIVGVLLAKPLGKFLEDRRNTIKSDLEHSRIKLMEAETMLADQAASLESAKNEARELKKRMEETAEKEKEALLTQARADAQILLVEAKKQIDQTVEKARTELQSQTAKLAIDLSTKLIKKNIDPKTNEQLIAEAIEKR